MPDFDNWGSDYNQPSRRDLLEIDSGGKTTSEHKKERRKKQQERFNEYQKGQYRGSTEGWRRWVPQRLGHGRQSEGTWLGFIVAILIIAGLIWLVWASMNGQLRGPLRSFNSSQTANQNALTNAFLDLEEQNKNVSRDLPEWMDVYNKNRIHDVNTIHLQVYPEYIIYVYTANQDADRAFNEFVNDWETDRSNIPIYRVKYQDIGGEHYLKDILTTAQPAFIFFKGTNEGVSKYDSMMLDPKYFNEIKPYTEVLINDYDELQRDRIGTYGQSKGFTDLTNQIK